MIRNGLMAVMIFALLAFAAAAPAQQTSQDKLKAAIAWLHKIEPEFSADAKAMVPSVEAILERYYLEPDTLRQSEKDIAEAFIATMPSTDEISGRGSPDDRMKQFMSILGTAPKKKPTTAPPPHHTTPPPSHPKVKVPGISTRPTYIAVQKTAPGGKKIGAVIVSVEGRKKTLIEIYSIAPKMTLQQRAQIVANRMKALSAKNPIWWASVKAGTVNGEAVVRAAGAPGGYVVTADKPFADECGVTPAQLARQLANKIRTTLDNRSGDEFGGRDLTPEQMRQAAIDLRQEGDDLYSTSAAQAEEKYKLAIQNDATYHVPYLRLADLYKSQHKIDQAKDILQQGLKVDAIQGSQRAELEAKLKSLG
ncbi:MAG TPA: hypothetical protein VG820_01585 [Fimbriimonadaceae bacterium]|nr:hypothetical protein [Fimbriimonadaceae bacterium]